MDLMLGQSDRHNGNYAIHATNGKVVAFDNGANGRFAEIYNENQRGKGLIKWELHRDRDPNPSVSIPNHPGINWVTTTNYPYLAEGLPDNIDRDTFIAEFDDWFDNHFDMDKVLDIGEACNMQVVGELMDGTTVTTEVIKDRLREFALYTYGNPGYAFDQKGWERSLELPNWLEPGASAKVNDQAPPPSRSVTGSFRELTLSAGGGVSQPVQSSKDSRPEFQIIKQRYE
jgi:hypothetical protein